MLNCALLLIGLFGATNTARPPLAFASVQPCYGRFGPARAPRYLPEEVVHIRFLVAGAAVDTACNASVRVTGELTGPDGKRVAEGRLTHAGRLCLGPTFVNSLFFALLPEFPPGEYTLTLTATDHLTCRSAAAKRTFTLLPCAFAFTPPVFSFDGEGKDAAPYGKGLLGQVLYVRLKIVGIEAGDRMEVESRMEVLDARTGRPLCTPLGKVDRSELPVPGPYRSLAVSGHIGLHQAGDYILRFSAHDRLTGKRATRDVPLHVSAP